MPQTIHPNDLYVGGTFIAKSMVAPASSIPTAALQANAVTAAKLTATLATGFIDVLLSAARVISANDIQNLAAVGGMLAKDSTPVLERVNGATDPSLRIKWAASGVQEIQFPPIPYPPDLDPSQPVVLNVRAKMGGATNTPTLTFKYFENVGGTDKGGATAALSAVEQTLTLNVNSVATPPAHANITLTPGAHGTDTVELHALWLTYTRL